MVPAGNLVGGLSAAWKRKLLAAVKPLSGCQSLSTSSVSNTQLTTLDNGIRVASETLSDSANVNASVKVFIDTGSRYETEQENGAANVWSKMMFKGTQKRPLPELKKDAAKMVGSINSSVSREEMVVNAKFVKTELTRTMDILGDILQNSTFDEKELQCVKQGILKEMDDRHVPNFQGPVMDMLHSVAFQRTPLGKAPIGSTEGIEGLTKDSLNHFVDNSLKGVRIVVAGAGNFSHDDLCREVEKSLGKLGNQYKSEVPLDLPCKYTGSGVMSRDDSYPYAYTALAAKSVGWKNPDYLPLTMANRIIGRWSNQDKEGQQSLSPVAPYVIEGKLGPCFEAFHVNYKDTGLWGAFFMATPTEVHDFTWHIQNEWRRMAYAVTPADLARVKNEMKAELAVKVGKNADSISQDIGEQFNRFGKRATLEERIAQIESVTPEVVADAYFRNIYDTCPAVACFGRTEALPGYDRLRGQMWSVFT